MGIVCPLGEAIESVWDKMKAGESGISKTTIFDASTFPTTFSAEVKNYDFAKYLKNAEMHKHSNRGSRFALGATVQACRQAGIDIETEEPTDGIARDRLGIYLGAGEGSADNDVFFTALVKSWNDQAGQIDWGKWTKEALATMRPMHELEQESNMPVSHIAVLTGARGPTRSCLTACAASTQAIGEATMIIRRGP